MNFLEILEEAVSARNPKLFAGFIWHRMKKEIQPTDRVFDIARLAIKHLPGDLDYYSDREKLVLFRTLDELIRRIKGENYPWGSTRMAWDKEGKHFSRDESVPETLYNKRKHTQFKPHNVSEGNNPYLTQAQKYTKDHPNQNGHQHSMRRMTGNDTARQTKQMVPDVRNDLKNPYESNVANKAQNQARVLNPVEIQQISNDYNLDLTDRRVKTIKGKTNMILTPLQNGGWKLEHR